MSNEKEINYSKPFYINSFDADEIIFHMLRGSTIKADKYDGSLPVSLDSLKIRELCKKDKSICMDKTLFRDVTRKDRNSKTFSDAVINVNFSVDPDYTKVNAIKEDAEKLKKNDLNLDNMYNPVIFKDGEQLILKDKYKYFLENYNKNKDALEKKSKKEKSKKDQYVIKYPDNFEEFKDFKLCEDNQYQVTKLSVKMSGTRASISTTIERSKDANDESLDLRYYVYFIRSEDEETELLGVYEEENIEVSKDKRKSKTIKSEINLLDLVRFDKEKKIFILDKGVYIIYIEGEKGLFPVVALELVENLEKETRYREVNWKDETEWDEEKAVNSSVNIKKHTIDTELQDSYRECKKSYKEFFEEGVRSLCNNLTDQTLDEEETPENMVVLSGYAALSAMEKDKPETLKRRILLYTRGFDVLQPKCGGKKHYVAYKRSASKSKTGGCLFIWDKLYEKMMDWTWMSEKNPALRPSEDQEYDLTSIKAYEALTLSGITKSFKLKANNILMIDAIEGKNVGGNRRIICKESDTENAGLVLRKIEDCNNCPVMEEFIKEYKRISKYREIENEYRNKARKCEEKAEKQRERARLNSENVEYVHNNEKWAGKNEEKAKKYREKADRYKEKADILEKRKPELEKCKKKMTEYKNTVWDGQALLDESVFEEIFGDEQHGMMLLRNHFFKACAFNAKIQKYYKDKGIEKVSDKYGNIKEATNIKLIITPDSLKYLKFAEDLFKDDPKEGEENKTKKNNKTKEEKAYKHWAKNLADFGVVKWDKPSNNDGKYNVGYQILNTLPLTEDNMTSLFKEEKKYIETLWKDPEEFVRKIPKESAKGKYIYEMYRANKEFAETEDFNNYRNQYISDYKRRLRRGRIRLEGTMYTLCSMPYEMLEYSGKTAKERKSYTVKPLLGPGEAYIQGLSEKEQIVLFRYPHLSSGSVCVLENIDCPEIKEYFNLNNNKKEESSIVVVSPWESNIMVKMGGMDFDSDTALFVKNNIIKEAAGKLFLTKTKSGKGEINEVIKPLGPKFNPIEDGLPVAQAAGMLIGAAPKYEFNSLGWATLDAKLAKTQTSIGSISNDIQLFNSYLWEALLEEGSKNKEEYVQKIYECILKLSVLNELEIDRAKHELNLETSKIRRSILDTVYTNENGKEQYIVERNMIKVPKKVNIQSYIKVNVKSKRKEKPPKETRYKGRICHPAFLYEIKKDNGNNDISLRANKFWNCPVDNLSKQVSSLRKTNGNNSKIVVFEEKPNGKCDCKQKKYIEKALKKTIEELRGLDGRQNENDEKYEERSNVQGGFIDYMQVLTINDSTMVSIIKDIVCKKKDGKCWNPDLNREKGRALGLLFMAGERRKKKRLEKEDIVLKCLRMFKVMDKNK